MLKMAVYALHQFFTKYNLQRISCNFYIHFQISFTKCISCNTHSINRSNFWIVRVRILLRATIRGVTFMFDPRPRIVVRYEFSCVTRSHVTLLFWIAGFCVVERVEERGDDGGSATAARRGVAIRHRDASQSAVILRSSFVIALSGANFRRLTRRTKRIQCWKKVSVYVIRKILISIAWKCGVCGGRTFCYDVVSS